MAAQPLFDELTIGGAVIGALLSHDRLTGALVGWSVVYLAESVLSDRVSIRVGS